MKTRLCSVLFSVLFAAAAFADSYTIKVLPGFNLIANQLDHGGNTLNEVFPIGSVPDGSQVGKYSCNLGQWTLYTYDGYLGDWIDPDLNPAGGVVLAPGEGAAFHNVMAAPVNLTFTGVPHVPVLPNLPCGCGKFNLVSLQRPTVGIYETITGLSPTEGTTVMRLDPVTGTYVAHTFSGGAWTPTIPAASPGESVFVNDPCDTNQYKWLQPPEPLNPTNVFLGWNQPSMEGRPPIAADDWVCTSTNPVTRIRWWGSFLNWQGQGMPQRPIGFLLRFWTDVPKGADPQFPWFSHPGGQLWAIYCTNFTATYVGRDYDPRGKMYESCFLFEQNLLPWEYFYQEQLGTGTNILWLSIEAMMPNSTNAWGWKTRPRYATSSAPDDAVMFDPRAPFYHPLYYPGTNDSWDLCFELFSQFTGEKAKWYQPPDLRPSPQGLPLGMDVNASYESVSKTTNLLADDFLCTETGPITNISVWGSWYHDSFPGYPPTNITFTLSFHRDVPVPNPYGYSMPGKSLWVRNFVPGQYQCVHVATNIDEGWFSPTNIYEPIGDRNCFRYDFNIPSGYFVQQGTPTAPVVYWLDVQATMPTGAQFRFGWKTSTDHWNDDATYAYEREPFDGLEGFSPRPWRRLTYPFGHELYPQTVDLAFRLNNRKALTEETKWSQPPEPYYVPDAFNGWNEYSVHGSYQIVADDWVCTTTTPVTDIHWWGSFINWDEPYPPQMPNAFQIAFWTDVPKGAGNAYSHPGVCLKEVICTNFTWSFAGWDYDPFNPLAPTEACFRFEQQFQNWEFFQQEPGTNTYWVSIAAMYWGGQIPPYPWGWKTRPRDPTSLAPDDAVRIIAPTAPLPGMQYLFGTNIAGWDMAFALTTKDIISPTNDFGDAPAPYPTLLVNNGARHTVVPGVCFGNLIDAEFDGLPHPLALGDDNNNLADEDGIFLSGYLVAGEQGNVQITTSVPGFVSAWVDFRADGSWAEAGDQILANVPVVGGGGSQTFTFPVPWTAARGSNTFARFRFCTVSNAVTTYTGPAPDGEVQDYQWHLEELDFGDTPDPTFPTVYARNGARHVLAMSVYMGPQVDSESDGQPNATATGDDLAGLADEDGVTPLDPLLPGQPARVRVVTSITNGVLDAWIDFGADGSWAEPGDRIANNLILPLLGPNTVNFMVPNTAAGGSNVFARFRFSTIGCASYTGLAQNGEVEDYRWKIDQLDFGDAPDPTFPTLLANNGARHILGNLFLGNRIDAERDGQPNLQALGDDLAFLDDEDGVNFPTALIANAPATIQVTSSGPGFLQAWFDYNRDGDWTDPGEQPIANRFIGGGTTPITLFLPNVPPGKVFARFRLSSVTNLSFVGLAPNGEVEDYEVTFTELKWVNLPEQGYEGVDVDNRVALADDFVCRQTGPVTDIHLWGSFFRDILPVGGPGNMGVTLSFYTDVPAGPLPYSHPGQLLWSKTFAPGQFGAGLAMSTSPGEWWHQPPNFWMPFADTNIWQFDFYIKAAEAFQQVSNRIYWLEVKHSQTSNTNSYFGWKSSYMQFQDAACWFNSAIASWQPLFYGDGHPRTNKPIDLAFALSTEQLDWGDAPDSPYPTLGANNGARHVIVPGLALGPAGTTIDRESDGQPNANASGDDVTGIDDEDGVSIPQLTPGQPASVTINVVGSGYVNAWIDFAADGSWAQPGDQIAANLVVTTGTYPIAFNVPTNAPWGATTFARFRFSTVTNLSYTGFAPDGEVEDHPASITRLPTADLGDAPDSSNSSGPPTRMTAYPGVVANFPTVFALGSPPHGPIHWNPAGAFLGLGFTGEWEADLPPDQDIVSNLNPPADVANLDGMDDGLIGPVILPHCGGGSMTVFVSALGPPMPLFLNVWFDWNRDGDWNDAMNCPDGSTAPEWAVQNFPVPSFIGPINLPVKAWHPSTDKKPIWVRITLSEMMSPPPIGSFTGLAAGDGPPPGPIMPGGFQFGETEDYYLTNYDDTMPLDFGDAPATYPTTLPNGARHQVIPGFLLGGFIDAEPNGLPDPAALGDDNNNVPDDEDGVQIITPWLVGARACVNVNLVSGPFGGRLDAWVDFNLNGVWDAAEQVFNAQPLAPGFNGPLCFPMPCSAKVGTNFARFRLTSTGGVGPGGLAQDGEVEDYQVVIYQPWPPTNILITNIVVTNLVSGGVTNQEVTIRWIPQPCVHAQVQAVATFSNTPPIVWTNAGPQINDPAFTFVETNAWRLEKYYRVIAPYTWP